MENEAIFETINTKLNPFEIFQKISDYYDDLFIFESLEGPKELIKSSIIGFGPNYRIKCLNKKLLVFDKGKKIEEISTIDPFNQISKFFTSVKNQDYRYVGGLVGYTNYESIKY